MMLNRSISSSLYHSKAVAVRTDSGCKSEQTNNSSQSESENGVGEKQLPSQVVVASEPVK
jgi:hypothetical protein